MTKTETDRFHAVLLSLADSLWHDLNEAIEHQYLPFPLDLPKVHLGIAITSPLALGQYYDVTPELVAFWPSASDEIKAWWGALWGTRDESRLTSAEEVRKLASRARYIGASLHLRPWLRHRLAASGITVPLAAELSLRQLDSYGDRLRTHREAITAAALEETYAIEPALSAALK